MGITMGVKISHEEINKTCQLIRLHKEKKLTSPLQVYVTDEIFFMFFYFTEENGIGEH